MNCKYLVNDLNLEKIILPGIVYQSYYLIILGHVAEAAIYNDYKYH